MKTKFELNEEVAYKAQKTTIVGISKNFSTNKLSYKIKNGTVVTEDQLSKLKTGNKTPRTDPELITLRNEYEQLFKKSVAPVKKNDKVWIASKVKAEKERIAALDDSDNDNDETPWDVIAALDETQLVEFIATKELDIDPALYASLDELKVAAAEELEIEVPEDFIKDEDGEDEDGEDGEDEDGEDGEDEDGEDGEDE